MTLRRRSRRVATLVALVVVLLVGAWVLVPRRQEVLAALAGLDPALVAVSLVLTLAGVALTAQVWATWLAALARPLPTLTAHRLFYVTQSAKYLPGGLWPMAAQVAVSRRFGVAVSAMVTASSLFLLTHLVTGVAVGVALLGARGDLAVVATSQVVALVGLAALTPPGMRLLLRLARLARPGLDLPVPRWATVARAVVLMLAAWGCYGAALLALARSAGDSATGPLLSTGAFAVAWVTGFLAVAVPAGVGVRETVVVATLAPNLGVGEVLAVAVVSRSVFTLVDLGLAAASVGVIGRLAPQPAVAEPGRDDVRPHA